MLLICGVLTYVGVLEEMGTIDYVGEAITQVGAPAFAALLISYIGAIVSAFASSTGMLAATIPLAVPFLQEDALSAIGVVTAVAISTTVVDASPLSTSPSSLPTPGTLIGTCSSATYLPTVLSWQSWLPRWPGLSSWCWDWLIEDAATCWSGLSNPRSFVDLARRRARSRTEQWIKSPDRHFINHAYNSSKRRRRQRSGKEFRFGGRH